jgi:hypothetical protein
MTYQIGDRVTDGRLEGTVITLPLKPQGHYIIMAGGRAYLAKAAELQLAQAAGEELTGEGTTGGGLPSLDEPGPIIQPPLFVEL